VWRRLCLFRTLMYASRRNRSPIPASRGHSAHTVGRAAAGHNAARPDVHASRRSADESESLRPIKILESLAGRPLRRFRRVVAKHGVRCASLVNPHIKGRARCRPPSVRHQANCGCKCSPVRRTHTLVGGVCAGIRAGIDAGVRASALPVTKSRSAFFFRNLVHLGWPGEHALDDE